MLLPIALWAIRGGLLHYSAKKQTKKHEQQRQRQPRANQESSPG
jgi:hypothetical protein